MSKTMKNIPKVRFPEFRDTPEWEIKPLKNRAENLDNLRIPITEGERRKGDIPYYGASGIIDYVEDYIFHEDLLCVSEDGANLVMRNYPIAFSIAGKTWVNNHAHVLRFKEKFTQIIIENYLNSMKLDDYITGMAQPKLNKAMLDSIPIPLPFELKEQQKIAECLSSIDALILAQSSKVEALKAHKKALMQQLFPTEGETIPRLRFPEFQNDGEWEEKKLIDYKDLVHGDGDWILSNDITDNGQIKIIQLASIGFGQYIEKFLKAISKETFKNLKCKSIEKGDLLINRMVDGCLNSCIFNLNGNYITSVDVCWIRQNEQIDNYFFMSLLSTPYSQKKLLSLASGGGRIRISKKNLFESFTFLIPSKQEQQKIAECLSSLDALISAQSSKVEALKQHKKALMQQLFPTCKVTS